MTVQKKAETIVKEVIRKISDELDQDEQKVKEDGGESTHYYATDVRK